jgi:hypothetical protein
MDSRGCARRTGPIIVMIVASGCDLVFLDRPAPPGIDAPITEPSIVTGRYLRRTVVNDASYFPIAIDEPMTEGISRVTLEDGTRPELTMHPDGRFSFERGSPDQPYRLFAGSLEYQLAASHLELVDPQWGRIDRDIAAPGTTLTYQVQGVSDVIGKAYVQTTGLWTQTQTPALNTQFTIAWDQAGSLWGERGLLRADRHDRAYYTLHELVTSLPSASPHYAIVGYRIDEVTMTSSQDTLVTGTISYPPRDRCVRIAGAQKTEMDRMIAAGYGTVSDYTANWVVNAVPRLDVGPGGGLNTAYMTAAGASIVNTNEDVVVMNPFNGHALVVTTTVYLRKPVTGPGATSSHDLSQISQHWVPATEGCTAPSTVGGVVAVPLSPSLDSRALVTDDTAISIDRTALVPLTWSLTSGSVDRYVLILFELGASTEAETVGQTTLVARAGWVTVAPSVAIDPALLVTGKSYLFAVVAEVGFAGAAAGDFGTIGYPHGQAVIHTPSFRIEN